MRATSDDGSKEYVGQYLFSVGESYETSIAAGALAAVMACCALVMWRRSSGAKSAPPTARPQGPQSKPDARPDAKPEGSAAGQST